MAPLHLAHHLEGGGAWLVLEYTPLVYSLGEIQTSLHKYLQVSLVVKEPNLYLEVLMLISPAPASAGDRLLEHFLDLGVRHEGLFLLGGPRVPARATDFHSFLDLIII